MKLKINLKLKKIRDKGEALGICEDSSKSGIMRSAEVIYEAYDGAVILFMTISDKNLREIKKKLEKREAYLVFEEGGKSKVEK